MIWHTLLTNSKAYEAMRQGNPVTPHIGYWASKYLLNFFYLNFLFIYLFIYLYFGGLGLVHKTHPVVKALNREDQTHDTLADKQDNFMLFLMNVADYCRFD